MRMHFRPRLASYYKAGAVLGAIFDAALESRYRRHLVPRAPDFAHQAVGTTSLMCPRSSRLGLAARCGASARLSSGCERDQVEVPVLVWARENRNRPLRPTTPGAVATGTDGSQKGSFVRVQLKFRLLPAQPWAGGCPTRSARAAHQPAATSKRSP